MQVDMECIQVAKSHSSDFHNMEPTKQEKQILEILKGLAAKIDFGKVSVDISFQRGKISRIEITESIKSIVLE